jgi:hypothetical protein
VKNLLRLTSYLILQIGAAVSHASTAYNLSSDFSNSLNPNGPWSFSLGATPLSHFIPVNNGNHLIPSVGNGYWGTGNNLNDDTPDVFKTTVSGSSAGETDSDFLSGDVIVHSPNAANGIPLLINWTAPTDGEIQYSLDVWYAHSIVDRKNQVELKFNGNLLTTSLLDKTSNRNLPALISSGQLAVKAGDVLSIQFSKTSGQQYGSLNGVNELVTFTSSVPELSSLASASVGLALLIFMRELKRYQK